MAVVTYQGHTKRAIEWFKRNEIYIGIGGKTAWTDEMNPPDPVPSDVISDVICVKKVEQKYYVVEDAINGTIDYRGSKYKILSEAEAKEQNCRWVFVSTWLNYDEAPVGVTYRKCGIYTDLTRKSTVNPAKYVLLPSEIENYGTLEVIAFDTPTTRSKNKRDRIAAIIEF